MHVAPPPARIPFHLPPKGTGAPASERVPASSGPPVLTSSPSKPPILKRPPTAKPPGPPRLKNPYEAVPFEQIQFAPLEPGLKSQTTPEEAPRPRLRRKPMETDFEPLAAPAPPVEEAKKVEGTVALPLGILLRNLPAFQLTGRSRPRARGRQGQFSPIADCRPARHRACRRSTKSIPRRHSGGFRSLFILTRPTHPSCCHCKRF